MHEFGPLKVFSPLLFCVKVFNLTPNPYRSSLSGAACTPREIFPPLLLKKMKIRPCTTSHGQVRTGYFYGMNYDDTT